MLFSRNRTGLGPQLYPYKTRNIRHLHPIAQKKTGQVLVRGPNIKNYEFPHQEGAMSGSLNCSELVTDTIKFADTHHRSARDFKQRVELALPAFGERVAESITTRELQDWMDEMAQERAWTGGTRNRVKSSLSTVFREAMRDGKVSGNPARLIRRSKEPMGRVRFLSYKEEDKLRKAIAATLPGRIRDEAESAFAQLDIALHTGMRKSEQFTTTWDQVDLERGFIYLSMTKNGSDRYVTLNSAALQVLKRLKERHSELGLPSGLNTVSFQA